MIHKYSLQFKDKKLEEKYQEFQLEHKRKPLAKTITILLFIVIIIQSVFTIMDLNMEQVTKNIAYLIGIGCLVFILYKKPQFIRGSFIIISLLFLLTYINAEQGKNQFHYQLISNMILTLQFVIIATGEFLDALFQIVIIYLVQIIYFIKYQENFSYSILASEFMTICLLINSFYKNNVAERSQFQLTLIEDQWDQVLNNSITYPSIIFKFDLIKNYFSLKKSIRVKFSCDTNDQLKNFLRETKIVKANSITLENQIYNKLCSLKKTSEPLINEKLFIYFQNCVQEIKYSIYPGASPIILIELLKNQDSLDFEKIEKLYQVKYLTLLRTLKSKLKTVYQNTKQYPKDLLKIMLYQDLQERRKNIFQMRHFNLNQVLKKLGTLYLNKSIQVVCNSQNLDIFSEKYALILLLMEIFESSISNEIVIFIKQLNYDQKVQFKVVSLFNEKTIENFEQRSQKFLTDSIKVSMKDGCIIFYIKSKNIEEQV